MTSLPLGSSSGRGSSSGPASADGPSSTDGPAENLWTLAVQRNPDHARGYAERWRRLQAQGQDIVGEARLIDAMAPRGGRILDAGCGTGRLGGHLAQLGHRVVGVDLDPELIAVAREDHPQVRWEVQNLAELDLRDDSGEPLAFDVAFSAGNVFAFFAESERRPALERLAAHLAPEGRLAVGFGAGRGYAFEDFLADARASGLREHHRLSSWDLRPAADDFLVAILGRD
jgi:SAM-dependent methyltransferase